MLWPIWYNTSIPWEGCRGPWVPFVQQVCLFHVFNRVIEMEASHVPLHYAPWGTRIPWPLKAGPSFFSNMSHLLAEGSTPPSPLPGPSSQMNPRVPRFDPCCSHLWIFETLQLPEQRTRLVDHSFQFRVPPGILLFKAILLDQHVRSVHNPQGSTANSTIIVQHRVIKGLYWGIHWE